jgi:hypothetical protein
MLSSVRYTKWNIRIYVYKLDQHYTVCNKDGRFTCRLPFPEQYPAPLPHTRYHCQAHCFMVACDYYNYSGDIARPTSAFIHRQLLGLETCKRTDRPNSGIVAVINCFSGNSPYLLTPWSRVLLEKLTSKLYS